MEDLRKALRHVLWIGGGPQAGKTTLAARLAAAHGLEVYSFDAHWQDHARRPGPEAAAFARLSMDERWWRPSVDELVRRSIAIYAERFACVVEDLRALPRSRPVVVEGPGILPWSVAPVIDSCDQALFLVPTPDLRASRELDRWGPGQERRFPGITERAGALEKVRERDRIIDARIIASCRELGLRCEVVDGSRDIAATLALVEEHFRRRLGGRPHV